MTENPVTTEKILNATKEISEGVGLLMPDLTKRLTTAPLDLSVIQEIVESPDRDMFIARQSGLIVGSAVMNLIVFTTGRKAWLEDFVVSSEESIRGKGVGYALWHEIETWSRARRAPLEFTSSPLRESAHAFYHRQGAHIKPTSVFHYDP